MQALVIEDEIPAANRLLALLKKYLPAWEIIGPLDSNKSLMKWFENHPEPQLLFSDIELLDGPVFKSLAQLKITAPIIFTTAYNQYMLDAFEMNGISYLLKPFDDQQVQQAIHKYETLKQNLQANQYTHLMGILQDSFKGKNATHKERLPVKVGQRIYLLKTRDICFIKMDKGMPFAHDVKAKRWPLSATIAQLELKLDSKQFFTINRGEIVNIDFIKSVEPYFKDRLAILVSGYDKPLLTSSSRTAKFRKWLQS